MNDSAVVNRRYWATNQFDLALVIVTIAMLGLGATMVYSSTIAMDKATLEINHKTLIRHLAHISLGCALMFLVSFTKLRWLQLSSKKLLLGGIVLLILVVLPGVGHEANGSTRWLAFGGIQFQPSELVKIAAVIYFADYLSRKNHHLHLFKVGILNIGLVIGTIGFLLIAEPDFGTTVVVVATAAGMMFLAGVKFLHFFVSSCVAVALMAVILVNAQYRLDRLMSYRNPWADPYDSGFQLSQSLIAIGRGEWWGTGLGSSIQKLFYLPHASNDFLVAIIGEELGAVGILAVLLLFLVFLLRCFMIARKAFNQGLMFSGLLAQGIGLLFALQASIHIGVNIGLLPTKGLNLPLLSYGGSSMISCLIMVGLLFAIDKQANTPRRFQERTI